MASVTCGKQHAVNPQVRFCGREDTSVVKPGLWSQLFKMNRLYKFAACISLVVAAQVVSAAKYTCSHERVGGYTWSYNIKGKGAEIWDCCGDCAVSPCPTGAVTIPSTLGGKPVKRLGSSLWQDQGVFAGCNRITSVTIPNSVTRITEGALAGCDGVMSFVVAKGNPSYKSVSGLLLTKNGKKLVSGVNGNVSIPKSVTSIGGYAFAGRSGLKSVKIPSSVTSIGGWAFSGCSRLRSIVFDGNQPRLESPIATDVNKNCTVYVRRDSNWYVDIPGEWYGLRIKYIVYRTVKFNANGGTVSTTSRKVVNGESVGTLPKATRKGYKFKGWYTKKSGGTKVKASTKVKKSVTYYAHWTAKKNKFNVR